MLTPFRTALGFLTLFHIPGRMEGSIGDAELGRSFAAFPLVGGVLGFIQACGAMLGAPEVPHLLLAFLLISLGTILTRGLHLDGLADCADGLWGSFERQRRLQIMKDSRVGTFGVLALILGLGMKVAAVVRLVDVGAWVAFVWVPVLSRYLMVLVAYQMPYVRSEGGLGRPFLENLTGRELTWATVALLGFAPLGSLKNFFFLVLTCPFLALGMRRASRQCLGGVTGDVLGATNEVGEICFYIASVFVFR